MKQLVSPKEVASVIGVSESSIKRWCDRGELTITRTAGGHRRIPVASVLRFVRDTKRELLQPALLGLPENISNTELSFTEARSQLFDALVEGHEERTLQILLQLYLQPNSLALIGDHVIAPVMFEIGEKWDCGDVQIFQERRSCEVCLKAFHDIRLLLLPVPEPAPLALVATPEGDPYTLSLALSEMVLLENHWQTKVVGTSTPFAALKQSLLEQQPAAICCLSVSFIEDETAFIDGCNELYQTAIEQGTALVLGGQALHGSLRKSIKYSSFCDTLQHLEQTAMTLYPLKLNAK